MEEASGDTAHANIGTSATTTQLTVVLWVQIALSSSRGARGQWSTFNVQRSTLDLSSLSSRAYSTADHTPPAHDLDKLGAVTQSTVIDDHFLLLLIYREEQVT
jgi:hypothetical protein